MNSIRKYRLGTLICGISVGVLLGGLILAVINMVSPMPAIIVGLILTAVGSLIDGPTKKRSSDVS